MKILHPAKTILRFDARDYCASMRINITKKTKKILARDQRVMLKTTRGESPFVPDHGNGDFIYDAEGNQFIDFSSFISVYNLGVNSTKSIRDAVKKQVDKLMHPAFTDYYAEPPVRFAESLISMFPKGFGRAFFSNSGTEANEAALKFSKIFTKRIYTIAFYDAFHGRTYGSLSMTSSKAIHRQGFGPFGPVIHVPYPNPYRCPLCKESHDCSKECIDYIKDFPLAKEVAPQEVAAIFIEPIQGEGGYVVPPRQFVKEIRKLADEHGILLVDDEVQAGYMRTGKFLALDNFGVEADIYTMAKAIGGGLPMGATVTRTSLGNIPAGSHANTFGGNLVAIAAAQASLDYIKKNMKELKAGINRKSRYMMKRLNEMKERYEIIGDVRGIGLMIGVEFVKNKYSKEPAVKEHLKIINDCFYKGLILLPAGHSTIRVIPPLTMSDESIKQGMDIFENAVKAIR